MAEILATLARITWMRRDDDNSDKLVAAGDLIIEILVETQPGPRNALQGAILSGLEFGALQFHDNIYGDAIRPPAMRYAKPLEIPESRMLLLDFAAVRSDLRRHHPMSEMELSRSAVCALSALEKILPTVAGVRVLSLGWSPGRGAAAFNDLAASLLREAFTGSSFFPRESFPELELGMVTWDLDAAANAPNTPSSRLRI